jgi:purine catabolism regulator
MKLVQACSDGPLASARVVAGKDHLAREISWVQVVDHPDIEGWVKEGHLLLSTGFHWPREPAAASALVERLAARGVCGVVLAVPHFLDEFPRSSRETAELVGLPLLEIPWEIPFSEITRHIHQELVGQQARALARSEQIHRELTEAAVSGSSLHDVARVLAVVLARPVAILNQDGRMLGLARPGGAEDGPAEAEALEQALQAVFRESRDLDKVDGSTRPVRLRAELPDGRSASLMIYAARVRADRVGYVSVLERDAPLSALDLRGVEHAGTVAALQISHQRELSMQETRLGYALVGSLIEGRFEPTPQSFERAQLLGWNRSALYRLCTVLLDEPNPLSRDGFVKREWLVSQAGRSLERREIKPLIAPSANLVHALVPEALAVADWWNELGAPRMAMAVSQVHQGVEGMADAGRETAELIGHLKPGRVHDYDEMLFPRVLRGDAEARRVFLDRVFGGMDSDGRGRALLETAQALSDEGFHLQRTADRLDLHISSLRHRYDKLAERTGLNLESADGRFKLQVAVRLRFVAG